MLNTVFKFIRVAEIVIGKHWKTLSRVLKLNLICRGFGLLARAGVATAYLIYKTVHRNEFLWDQSIFTNDIPTKMYGFAKNHARSKTKNISTHSTILQSD